jgi:hypothetical protein
MAIRGKKQERVFTSMKGVKNPIILKLKGSL